jgi:hypothetical protein
MSPEDIARRFEQRQGYDLVDYSQVALPIYRLTVDSVTMAHREIPPIKEFVMRSVAIGIDSESKVAGFLGLDEATVHATFDQLCGDRHVSLSDSDDGSSAALLDRGREVLAKARESSPQDEMLVFLFDRLMRKPVRLGAEQLLAPANVDSQQMIEIRSYPADGPEIGDLSISDVLQVLEQQAGGRAAFGKDLLRLKRIVRRVRLYRPAIGLVYKKHRSSDIQIAFIVDDARHEGLEHAFAVHGGPKKMGFLRSIDESSTTAELRRYLGPEVQKLLPDTEELTSKRLAVSLARIKHQVCLGRVERRGGINAPEVAQEKEQLEAAFGILSEAETQLRTFPARPVLPYEIAEHLSIALDACQSLLVISSRNLGRAVVDARFLKHVEAALQRNVRVVISITDPPGTDKPAIELERLRGRYPRLELHSKRRAAFYHLICDDVFALVCNRPLLGNLGKLCTFHHVVGFLLQAPHLVSAFTNRVGADAGRPPGRDP